MSEANFIALQNKLFQIFHKERLQEVHDLIDEVQSKFPERMDKTLFWRACAFTVGGQLDDAIQVLRDGLQKGIWWNPDILTRDPDLHNLQSLDEFQSIVQECTFIFENNKREAKATLYTYGNPGSQIGIFSIHMRGNNVNDFAPYWLNENALEKYYFGFPQSSQVFGYHSYCWDNEETANYEIQTLFQDYKQKGNTKEDILAGASQGGKIAMELALQQKVKTSGFIVVIPAIRDLASMEKIIKERVNPSRGYIITGDKDPFYKNTLELTQLLERYHVPFKLKVIEGLGHFFPEQFHTIMEEAVDFILHSEK